MGTLLRFSTAASAVVIPFGFWLVCASALAQPAPPSPEAEQEARGLFDAGEVAYANGHFLDALDHFERAYALTSRVRLLFNIGLAAQRAERFDRAIGAYEAYLAAHPDAANRSDVELRIADCRTLRAAAARVSAASTPAPTPTEPRDPPRRSSGPGPVPWIAIAGGAALAISGGVLLGMALSDIGHVEDAPAGSSWADVSFAYDRAPLLSTFGFVLLGVGAAGAALGVVLLGTGSESEPEVRVSIGPGALRIAGRF